MKITALKCEMCGGELVPDASGEYAACGYCHTRHSLETGEKIKVEYSGKIQLEGTSLDEMLQRANTLLNLGEWEKAHYAFQDIADRYPDRFEGWWGLLKVQAENDFERSVVNPQLPNVTEVLEYRETLYNRALGFADSESAAGIKAAYGPVLDKQAALMKKERDRQANEARYRTVTAVCRVVFFLLYAAAVFLYIKPVVSQAVMPEGSGFFGGLKWMLLTYYPPILLWVFLHEFVGGFTESKTGEKADGVGLFLALTAVNAVCIAIFDSSAGGILTIIIASIVLMVLGFLAGLAAMFAGTLLGGLICPGLKAILPKAKAK